VADLSIQTKRDGKVAVLVLAGEARLERIEALRKEGKALAAGGVASLLVDVKGLTFADSASVGALLEMQKACAAAGGKFVMVASPPRLARQMHDMGLGGRFLFAPDEAAGRKLLG